MPAQYDIAVVAHKSRYKDARRLANRVNANCLSVDDGSMAQGFNHLRAWHWLRDGCSEWSIVLEDDAKPSGWFLSGDLTDVLKTAPGPVLSLYLGRGSPRHWQPSISRVIGGQESWLLGSELLHHVGVAIKTSVLPVILDDLDTKLTAWPIDEAIGQKCRRIGIPIAYCKPSIVDHNADIPSVITERMSIHPTDAARRTFDEKQRRAWVMATGDSTWADTTIAIPEPSF